MKTKNKNISYGKVTMTDDEFNLKDAKIRITMFVDFDVVLAYKALAKKRFAKYQTLMNQKLREGLADEMKQETLENRVKKLEDKLLDLKKKK